MFRWSLSLAYVFKEAVLTCEKKVGRGTKESSPSLENSSYSRHICSTSTYVTRIFPQSFEKQTAPSQRSVLLLGKFVRTRYAGSMCAGDQRGKTAPG